MLTVFMVLGGLVVGYFIGRQFVPVRPVRYVPVQPPPLDEAFPPPGPSARKAAESIREFGALVERLAGRGVAVSDSVCEPGKHWSLVVERGVDAKRHQDWRDGGKEKRWVTSVSWTAGDADLRVRKSIREPHAFPHQWQDEPGRPIGPGGDPIGAAEAFILERFAAGATPDR
ncbi:MAG TPA: hypothetical protein VK358_03550 [Longimicrobium sp.]|nr:hypothetical protein [Longimicrobium sp.]